MLPEPAAPHPRRGLFHSLIGRTAALALVVGVAALGAVHHLAHVTAEHRSVAAGPTDPEVTGSIASAARSVTLDPCTGRERLIVRGPVGRNN